MPQALEDPEIWVPEMDREFSGLMKIGAWKLIPRKPSMNIVRNKWVYAQKFLGDNEGTWKPKVQLVAKGFQQIPGIDYFETHASVVCFELLRIMCAIVTMHNMEIAQDDIEKAYLNATPSETIYMEQPPGYVSKEFPTHVCLMQWALYGFMQSSNNWWEDLDHTWSGMGFLCS